MPAVAVVGGLAAAGGEAVQALADVVEGAEVLRPHEFGFAGELLGFDEGAHEVSATSALRPMPGVVRALVGQDHLFGGGDTGSVPDAGGEGAGGDRVGPSSRYQSR